MAVKFLQDATVGAHYNEGEVAGFDAATEASLIKQKIAENFWRRAQAAAPSGDETK